MAQAERGSTHSASSEVTNRDWCAIDRLCIGASFSAGRGGGCRQRICPSSGPLRLLAGLALSVGAAR